ncbi:MAG: SIS domain-containing protein [bacterium]|nr:SIS domain-containing protein [bacterium]
MSAFNPQHYLSRLRKTLDTIDAQKIARLEQKLGKALKGGTRVFFAGNGGSAATASHIACDLGKTILVGKAKKGIRAVCLSDNVPLLTAWGNDAGYDYVFSEGLKNFAQKGDIFIPISASGNSPNILEAIRVAQSMGVDTFGMFGFEGGKAKKLVDDCLVVESNDYGVVEDIHMMVFHLITDHFKKTS